MCPTASSYNLRNPAYHLEKASLCALSATSRRLEVLPQLDEDLPTLDKDLPKADRPILEVVDNTPGEPTDDDLMLLARAGRRDVFEVLVRRHQKLVIALAVRFLGDATLGRDVAQDVFLAVWSERERYESRSRFRSYLVSVTLHRCQFVARQRRSHTRKLADLASETSNEPALDSGAMHELIEAEKRREVHEKLTVLPEPMRQVLILRFTHELPIEEIAKLTGLRLGTVKSHLHRGVRRLHQSLEKGGR